MTKQNQPASKSGITTRQLEITITDMDSLTQNICGEIEALSRLAITAVNADMDSDDITRTLAVIREKAFDLAGLNAAEAEQVGCNAKGVEQ